MKRVSIILSLILFLFPTIFASCESGQIDINSASEDELDNLYGIGPAKAQAIINSRPFDEIDDLINVVGIGEITLKNIKDQNLACIENFEEEEEIKEEYIEKVKENKISNEKEYTELVKQKQEKPAPETISLIPKTIKSEDDTKVSGKAIYGLTAFCILIGILFLFKRRKYKNEFE